MAEMFYKKYNRDQRNIASEETFQKGMFFTRAPINTQESRLLVNYDITSEGESLSPRKGLRTSLISAPIDILDAVPSITSDISLKQVSDTTTATNKRFRLAVANKFLNTDTAVANTNLYEASQELWVTNLDNTSFNILNEYDVETRAMYSLPLSYATITATTYDSTKTYNKGDFCYETAQSTTVLECKEDGVTGTWDSTKWQTYVYPKSYYYIPRDAEVHGIPLTNRKYIARPVGCFVPKDGAYYSFNNKKEFIRSQFDVNENVYFVEKIKPEELDAASAYSTGFNALLEEPYQFSSIRIDSGDITYSGCILYDKNNNIDVYPVVNVPHTVRLYYSAAPSKEYKIKFSYAIKGSSTYVDIVSREINTGTTGELPEVKFENFKGPDENIILKVQAYLKTSGSYAEDPELEVEYALTFLKNGSGALETGGATEHYDLSKCTGMTYWRDRLWLYGLASHPNKVFFSEYDKTNYFPVPYNVFIFDEPVVYCTPFNDTFLIFTKTQIIQITASSEDMSTATQKVIQSNLNFNEFDVTMIQTIKNMLFFQSGDYYYMIVPKTLSLQNELALAPVSKKIESFLDNFEENVKNLLELMYDYTGTWSLVHHYNYLNYEDVSNIYVIQTASGLLINIALLYNTVDRTWRIYTVESENVYYPLRQDATKTSTLIAPIQLKFNKDGTESNTAGLQFVDISRTNVRDFYIPNNSIFYKTNGSWEADNGRIQTNFNTIHTYKNYQVFDTGYRNISIDHNKRLRELQFKFNNVSGSDIKFSTDFILDGETRVNRYKYTTEHIIDPTDPNYGLLYINKEIIENVEIPGVTALANTSTDLDYWSLDASRFPEIAYWKARLKVSGKGYTPRFRLICKSEAQYEFLGYTWVYRLMYAR